MQRNARARSGVGPRSHLTHSEIRVTPDGASEVTLSASFRYRHSPGVPRNPITLLRGSLALRDLESSPPGAVVMLRDTGEDLPSLVLETPDADSGSVSLVLLARSEPLEDARRLTVHVPDAADCRVILELPEGTPAGRIHPAILQKELPGDESRPVRIRASVPPGAVTLEWGRNAASPVAHSGIAWQDASVQIEVTGDSVETRTWLRLAAAPEPVRELLFEAPETGEAVVEASIGNLETLPEGRGSRLVLPRPLTSESSLVLLTRRSLGAESSAERVFSWPVPAGRGPPPSTWLAVWSRQPLGASVAGTSASSCTPVSLESLPEKLRPASPADLRLALRCLPGTARVALTLDRWPSERQPVAIAESVEAVTRFESDGSVRTRLDISLDASTPELSFGPLLATSASFSNVRVDGKAAAGVETTRESRERRGDEGSDGVELDPEGGSLLASPSPPEPPAESPGGDAASGFSLRLDPPPAGRAFRRVEAKLRTPSPRLHWFGRLDLELPPPRFFTRSLDWKIEAPEGYVIHGPSGGPWQSGATPSHFLYRLGRRAARVLALAALWIGLPGIGIALLVLWLRRTPFGDQALSTAAGVVSVLMLIALVISLYMLAMPLYHSAVVSPRGTEGSGGFVPASQRDPSFDAEGRDDDASFSISGTRRSADELPPGPRDAMDPRAVHGPAPHFLPYGFPDPRPHPAGDAVASLQREAAALDRLALRSSPWLPPATGPSGRPEASAASYDPAAVSARPVVSLRYVMRRLVPVLEGLTAVLGFAMFLLLSLCFHESERLGFHGFMFLLALAGIWLVEVVLPQERSHAAVAFAVPLVVLALFRAVRWLLSPRFSEELSRRLGAGGPMGFSGSQEVSIADLFPDSDGISFVAERPREGKASGEETEPGEEVKPPDA